MEYVINCICSTLTKATPVPFMLEYDFQSTVTSFASIALNMMIMMIKIGTSVVLIIVCYPADQY